MLAQRKQKQCATATCRRRHGGEDRFPRCKTKRCEDAPRSPRECVNCDPNAVLSAIHGRHVDARHVSVTNGRPLAATTTLAPTHGSCTRWLLQQQQRNATIENLHELARGTRLAAFLAKETTIVVPNAVQQPNANCNGRTHNC
jgi:hypothetical protein